MTQKPVFIATALLLAWSTQASLAAPKFDPRPVSARAEWGKVGNPDGDCRFFFSTDMLLIHVPGGPRPHDLAAEIDVVNAPRVLQKAQGDFTVQVKVEGRFAPGNESMLPGRTPYNGAGLVAVFDENNVVTLARAVLERGDGKRWPYANFEIRKNGRLEQFGEETETPIPLDGALYLRLERRGMKMLGAHSTDGIHWHELEPKNLPGHWPMTLNVGVVAISTSPDEFNPRFSGLRLTDQ